MASPSEKLLDENEAVIAYRLWIGETGTITKPQGATMKTIS